MASIYDTGWWGFQVKVSKLEACKLATAATTAAVIAAAKIPQPYGTAAAAQIAINRAWILSKVQSGGGKGLLLKFNWLFIMIGIKRLSTGSSPCP